MDQKLAATVANLILKTKKPRERLLHSKGRSDELIGLDLEFSKAAQIVRDVIKVKPWRQ